MEYDALHLTFYAVIALTALVVGLALLKIFYRNLPLWLFELWPYALGFGLAAGLLWGQESWQWAAVCAGVGLALGLSWSAMLTHCRKVGREFSRLERVHWALVKWAQK